MIPQLIVLGAILAVLILRLGARVGSLGLLFLLIVVVLVDVTLEFILVVIVLILALFSGKSARLASLLAKAKHRLDAAALTASARPFSASSTTATG